MENEIHIIRPRPGVWDRDACEEISPNDGPSTPFGCGTQSGFMKAAIASSAKLVESHRRGATIALVLQERASFGDGLADAAADLLALGLQIRQVRAEIDVHQLHRQTMQLVERFRAHAAKLPFPDELAERASYLVCSFVDEAVLNTVWGENSSWSQRSLLRLFHRETWGGERVFRLIDAALNDAHRQQPLLELAYLAVALGFQGKYRVDLHGQVHLDQVRDRIYQALGGARDRAGPLPTIEPVCGRRRPLHSYRLIWGAALLVTLLCCSLGYVWLMGLDAASDRLRVRLAALAPDLPPAISARETASRPAMMHLSRLLAAEIGRGTLRVDEYSDRVSVELQAEALFEPGSAAIAPALLPVLDKIGKALEIAPGRVIVTGHTDSDNIRTARFPSNWYLSLARASEVVKYLSAVAALRGRLLPEGRGDSEPVAPNDSAIGRARNRRVTIDVYDEHARGVLPVSCGDEPRPQLDTPAAPDFLQRST